MWTFSAAVAKEAQNSLGCAQLELAVLFRFICFTTNRRNDLRIKSSIHRF